MENVLIFIEGEIFVALGVFKIFDMETKEFRNFLYTHFQRAAAQKEVKISKIESKQQPSFLDTMMNISSCLFQKIEEGTDTQILRKIKLDKRGTEARGDNIYVSKEPCQI